MPHEELGRVEALLELERYAEAARLVDVLLASYPHDSEVLLAAARCRLGLRDLHEALRCADRAVAAAPDDARGHLVRAWVLADLRRPADAAVAADEAIRSSPLLADAHACYAAVADDPASWGRRDPWDAAREAVRLAPHDAGSHAAMGMAATRRGDRRTAVRAYHRALALDPDHAAARNNLLLVERNLGVGRSARHLAAALRSAPQDPVIRGNVDVLVERLGIRLYVAALLALLAGVVVTHTGTTAGPGVDSVLLAVGVLAVLTVYVLVVARSVPVGFRRYATERLLRSRDLTWMIVVLVVVLGLFVAICTVADLTFAGPRLAGPVLAAGLTSLVGGRRR